MGGCERETCAGLKGRRIKSDEFSVGVREGNKIGKNVGVLTFMGLKFRSFFRK